MQKEHGKRRSPATLPSPEETFVAAALLTLLLAAATSTSVAVASTSPGVAAGAVAVAFAAAATAVAAAAHSAKRNASASRRAGPRRLPSKEARRRWRSAVGTGGRHGLYYRRCVAGRRGRGFYARAALRRSGRLAWWLVVAIAADCARWFYTAARGGRGRSAPAARRPFAPVGRARPSWLGRRIWRRIWRRQ